VTELGGGGALTPRRLRLPVPFYRRRTALVDRPHLKPTAAGQLCPNAPVDPAHRFDDLAAGRFALVTAIAPTAAQECEIQRRGAVVIDAAPGSELHRWLRRSRANAAVVRPDGTVLRAGRGIAPLIDALTPLRRPSHPVLAPLHHPIAPVKATHKGDHHG